MSEPVLTPPSTAIETSQHARKTDALMVELLLMVSMCIENKTPPPVMAQVAAPSTPVSTPPRTAIDTLSLAHAIDATMTELLATRDMWPQTLQLPTIVTMMAVAVVMWEVVNLKVICLCLVESLPHAMTIRYPAWRRRTSGLYQKLSPLHASEANLDAPGRRTYRISMRQCSSGLCPTTLRRKNNAQTTSKVPQRSAAAVKPRPSAEKVLSSTMLMLPEKYMPPQPAAHMPMRRGARQQHITTKGRRLPRRLSPRHDMSCSSTQHLLPN